MFLFFELIHVYFLFFSLVGSFMKNYNHFMNILLIFECFILLMFFNFSFYQDPLLLLFFSVFSVCESSLGLSLMVIMIRCSGSDFCSNKFLTC